MSEDEIENWVTEYLGYLAHSDDMQKASWLRLLIRHAYERGRQEGVQAGYAILQGARAQTVTEARA